MSDQETPARPLPVPTNFSQPFWDGAKNKKLMLQFCKDSGKYQFFPRPNSVYTGRRNVEWREASGDGEVYSFTITRRAPPPFRGKEPYVIGSIQLAEGPRIMAEIIGCDEGDVKIGAKVKIAWDEMNEDFNYPVFELAE
ncbi:MAG: Zn-ribbon domain-containing OB-fold protein [Rhodospirillales bacterium]|nr:Zn-ribbon domain-containing OB-fold protein [Rhodospirillales bacterium]